MRKTGVLVPVGAAADPCAITQNPIKTGVLLIFEPFQKIATIRPASLKKSADRREEKKQNQEDCDRYEEPSIEPHRTRNRTTVLFHQEVTATGTHGAVLINGAIALRTIDQ